MVQAVLPSELIGPFMERGFAVIGLGYVGLPVALALAKKFEPVVGFDISGRRIAALRNGADTTGEVTETALRGTRLRFTDDPDRLSEASFFVVTVPTPIDAERRPDLSPLEAACALIGPHLRAGSVVVFESTVYPGLTREFCGPRLAVASGLRQGIDFKLGYSPERINPGDKQHRLETIVKIVAGEDPETLERVAGVYACIVDAGVYRASSLEVAEVAIVIENTQRDLNIALMNELAIIFDRLGIATKEVLEAGTKWNFLPFTPVLVGGHCIGVDPYYLTARAEAAGYYPQVILSGRRINDGMGGFIAQRLVKLLIAAAAGQRRPDWHPRPHLQGGRARSAQQPRARHRRRIARIRDRRAGRRSPRRPGRGEARIRHRAGAARDFRQARR